MSLRVPAGYTAIELSDGNVGQQEMRGLAFGVSAFNHTLLSSPAIATDFVLAMTLLSISNGDRVG